MKKWRIPITYEMCALIEVEADRLEDAMDIARDTEGILPLPADPSYVDGSWTLSDDDTESVRACYNNSGQDYANDFMFIEGSVETTGRFSC